MKNRSDYKQTAIFALLFLLMLAFSVWRAPYGEVWDDESFYLSVPYRILQGDQFLVHEWNMAQMSAFLVLPLVKLFIGITGGTEGIYLFMRYMYVAFHCLVSLVIYLRLKKINWTGAVAASLIYGFYAYGNLMTLSYNTMGIGLMVIACMTMALSSGRWLEYLFSGLCFSGAVLCCPFLILVYAVYSTVVLVLTFIKKHADPKSPLTLRAWLYFTAACAIMAFLFFLPLLVSGEFLLIFKTLPQILQEDAHSLEGPLDWLRGFYGTFHKYNGFFKPVLIGSIVLTGIILLDKSYLSRRPLYLFAAVVLSFVFSVPYILMYRNVNMIMFGYSILGFFAFMLCENKLWRQFCFVYVPGVLYWFCVDMASNLGFSAIGGVSALTMIPSVIFVFVAFEEMKLFARDKSVFARSCSGGSMGAAAILIASLFSVMMFARVEYAVFDTPFEELTERIECGASKGVITSALHKQEYESEYHSLAPLREIEDGNVLYFNRNSIRVIEDSKRCAHCNLWFAYSTLERGMEKLAKYWELFPEKRPDYIYLDETQLADGQFLEAITSFGYDYTEVKLDEGAYLVVDWR